MKSVPAPGTIRTGQHPRTQRCHNQHVAAGCSTMQHTLAQVSRLMHSTGCQLLGMISGGPALVVACLPPGIACQRHPGSLPILCLNYVHVYCRPMQAGSAPALPWHALGTAQHITCHAALPQAPAAAAGPAQPTAVQMQAAVAASKPPAAGAPQHPAQQAAAGVAHRHQQPPPLPQQQLGHPHLTWVTPSPARVTRR